MKSIKNALLWVLFSTSTCLLPAQNIVISNPDPDTLVVCQADTFSVVVQNNHPLPLVGALLTASLTPSGLSYVPGSVLGAAQQNISNLSAPVFLLPDIPANQSVAIKILVSAECSAADLLDAMQVFTGNISVASALGSAQFSASIKVETGGLLIQSVSPEILMGEIGDTLQRIVCVQNTRVGKIGSLHFDDAHLEGFEASVLNAGSQTNGPSLFSAQFDGSLFESVGNGDGWLDQFESVCFTEQIVITSCGIPAFTNPSLLRAGWGCGGEVCRYDTFPTAVVQIKPSTKVPELVFEQIWAPPTDYCGIEPSVMGFKIKNLGKADAQNISFYLTLTEGLTQAGMVANSFRLATNNGSAPIAANIANATPLTACNLNALFEASFSIPLVPAGDSLEFLFDVITCTEPCQQVQPAFRADYFYTKDCPVNGFVSGNALINPEEGYGVKGTVRTSIGACLEVGQSYPFIYEAESRYLVEEGFWHLELDLPLGITFDPACGTLLGGNAPALFETTPLANGGQNVHLAWATPLQTDSLGMDFCLHYECDTNIVCEDLPFQPNGGVIYTDFCCFVRLNDATYWSPTIGTPQECAIGVCDDKLLGINRECVPGESEPGDSSDVVPNYPVPGLRDWWNAYRLNPGFQDSDDDRHADMPLAKASNGIRLDRFLSGDTLRVEYCGVMDSTNLLDTIGRLIWHEIVGGDMGQNDNDVFLTPVAQTGFADSLKLRWIANTVRVRYADGTVATCSWKAPHGIRHRNYFQIVNPNSFPIEPVDDIATMRFFFLYSLPQMFAEGCLPKPEIGHGDSIFIFSDFKLDLNFKPNSNNNPDPPLVGFRTATNAGGKTYAWNEQPHKLFQYSGWKKTVAPNTHSIKPCENSVEPKKFRYSMRIARENMFPNEVRPLAEISNYRQTLPPGLELASAKLEYLALQDSVPFLSDLGLPFSESPGFLEVGFAPAFAKPVDEGFTLRSNLVFKPNCQFQTPDTSKQWIETSFAGCLNGNQMTMLDSVKNPIGFFSNSPKLQVLTNNAVVFGNSRNFDILFDLKNLVVSNAPAAWVAVVSPSGLASNFELFQMPQNQPVVGTNGFFTVGNVMGFGQRSLRLTGQNVSCAPDSLLLIFGWGCTPVSSLFDASCGLDTFVVTLHLERPELELEVSPEPGLLTLCDTSDWFEFKIYNSKHGFAYDPEASVRLPQGLRIAAGTCQISYPEGAPWVNISDPGLLSGNLYEWQINNLLPSVLANGLPGINFLNLNGFRIRFKSIAECGFVANTPIIYGTAGTEPCGRQTNALNKPGDPLNILGLAPPAYGVQINLQPVGGAGIACASSQEFAVNLNILGTPSAGDSVYVALPQGISLQPNSYLPGLNAPPGPVTQNAAGFQLPLPILAGGGALQFRFSVDFGASAGCKDQVIQVQTRVHTVAFCQSLGAPCEVYVSTGEALWNLEIEHPQFSFSNVELSLQNGLANAALTITNIGGVAANGVSVQVWRDVDGDGLLSAGDLILQTIQSPASIGPGEIVQVTGALPGLDSTQLCGLLFVLPAEENCACEDQVFSPDHLNLKHTTLNFCELHPVTVGVPTQAGFYYQWQPASQVACPNCATTTFTPGSNTTQTLTLTESTAGCTVTHTFEITFGAGIAAIAGNTKVCDGAFTTLTATPPGTNYLWQGAGIQDPNQAAQVVQPPANGLYSVTITFANGCTATDSVEIEVLSADTVTLTGITTCTGEPVDVLGTLTDTPGVYQTTAPNIFGCDSTTIQTLSVYPKPMTEELHSFCYGGSLLVYDSLFTESGTLTFNHISVHGCDSIHLVSILESEPIELTPLDTIFGTYGQIITLRGPEGYVTYVWEPAPVPPCPNCASVMYPADSVGYHEYVLTVAGLDGCPGELIFRVVVFPPCSADSLFIPNAFTPNGDGKNDVFRVVKHEGAEVVSGLEIYDRWGEKVYENQGDAFWDGTIDGKPAPSDVYVYIVKVSCGELRGKRVGDVTLLR